MSASYAEWIGGTAAILETGMVPSAHTARRPQPTSERNQS